MQYDVTTPAAYLAVLEDDWRKEQLLTLRRLILELGPELKENIEYKMLAFGDGQKNLFHLNAQQQYVSLYVGNIEKVPGAKTLLEGLNLGKGCIRLTKSKDIARTGLPTFIQRVIDIHRQGGETDC